MADIPAGATLSDDGAWWWDGAQWQAVSSAADAGASGNGYDYANVSADGAGGASGYGSDGGYGTSGSGTGGAGDGASYGYGGAGDGGSYGYGGAGDGGYGGTGDGGTGDGGSYGGGAGGAGGYGGYGADGHGGAPGGYPGENGSGEGGEHGDVEERVQEAIEHGAVSMVDHILHGVFHIAEGTFELAVVVVEIALGPGDTAMHPVSVRRYAASCDADHDGASWQAPYRYSEAEAADDIARHNYEWPGHAAGATSNELPVN